MQEASSHGSRAPVSVLPEIAQMWAYAREAGIADRLRGLSQPRLARSLGAGLTDWALIAAAGVAVSVFGGWALPLGLFVIGNRQRALGNLLHDASHRSFDGNRNRASVLANLLFCWPLWVSMTIYRSDHNRHHRFLGDPARDPDFIHDETRLQRGWFSVWGDQVLSWRMFKTSLFSHLGRMDAATLTGVAVWWGVVLAAIAWLASPRDALIFAGLWVAARVLVFHPITSFREISDHVGLIPGGLMSFSRNHPFGGVLGQVFHPHNNGYHLLHHLSPGIPFHAIPRGHALLMGWSKYAASEQCDGYFRGERSAVRSWVRRWQGTRAMQR